MSHSIATPAAHGADASGDHHRLDERHRSLKEARVLLNDVSTIDCTVRNISKSGARLEFGDFVALPAEFRLHFVLDHTMVPAQLLWQRGLSAGVKFRGPVEPAPRKA